MWKMIRYSLSMRRTHSLAVLCTIAATVAVLFALLLTYQGTSDGVRTASDRMGADLMVVPADAAAGVNADTLLFTGAPVTMYLNSSLLTQVKGVEGVEAATAQFYGRTLDNSCCSATRPVRLIGFDASDDWIISSWAQMPSDEKLGAGRVIIGSSVDGFEAGRGYLLGTSVEVAAVLEPTGTDLDGSLIMDIDQVRQLSRNEEGFADLWSTYGDPDDLVSAILVRVEEGEVDEVRARLATLDGVSVLASSEVLSSVGGQLSAMLRVIMVVAVLMVLLSVLQLFARFYTTVWERRGELALYRALGATRRDLMLLIGGEAGILMAAGLVIGFVLGGLLFALVPSVLASAGSFPFIMPGVGHVALFAVAVVVVFAVLGLVAVLAPLRQCARVSPVAAMSAGDID